MKKNYFLISAVMALCLCACQGNNNGGKSSEPKMEPEKAPTTEVAFQELESNVMVTAEEKAYIDAMHEQEQNLKYPYRISNLFGPTDLKKMNDKAETGDGATYKADETGGVDVCTMLNNKQKYQNVPINLKWEKGDKDFANAKVRFWTELDHSDVREVNVESDGASAKLPNLLRNSKYYYQLVNGDEVSQMGEFQTADYTRVMTMGAVNNVRDLGGYVSSYGGVRTRQGLIFRGYEINEGQFSHSGTHNKTYSEEVQKVADEVMQLKLELDLRAKSGTYQGKQEKSAVEGVEYKRCAINSYAGFITDPNKTSESENADRNLPQEIFEALANAGEKHVYFHCWGGADRTGTIAFLLNAICGVSYTDLIIDFELTTQTNNKRCHMHNSSSAYFPKFLYEFSKIDGFDFNKTVNENAVTLLKKVGVSDQTIEDIRTLMIPGYKTGMQPTETINENGTDEVPTSSAMLLQQLQAAEQHCEHDHE